ncbi:MAG: hypothetical protein KJ674_04595 [Nanoarchaeota archaeon]|nr:hypothetical protein [Nanoarchaeota archaeon]
MKKSIMFLLILSIGVLFVISGCSNTPVGQKINSQQGQTPDFSWCMCNGATQGFECPGACETCCGKGNVKEEVHGINH